MTKEDYKYRQGRSEAQYESTMIITTIAVIINNEATTIPIINPVLRFLTGAGFGSFFMDGNCLDIFI